MQITFDVKRRPVVSAMPTITEPNYYNSFAVADARSVFEEVGRNCKHTRGRFAHPGGRRQSRRPPAGGVINMRRVAPVCACCYSSPTSLASFSAIAILAQAIGNIPLAASLCIPRARERLQPTVVRLAPVYHWSLTRASRKTERTFACTSQCRAQARHTDIKRQRPRSAASYSQGVKRQSGGASRAHRWKDGRQHYYKYGSQYPIHRPRFTGYQP